MFQLIALDLDLVSAQRPLLPVLGLRVERLRRVDGCAVVFGLDAEFALAHLVLVPRGVGYNLQKSNAKSLH